MHCLGAMFLCMKYATANFSKGTRRQTHRCKTHEGYGLSSCGGFIALKLVHQWYNILVFVYRKTMGFCNGKIV